MDKTTFEKLYDEYSRKHDYGDSEWDKEIGKWDKYFSEISGEEGLSIERWIKNENGYLPAFLDAKNSCFGRSRIGNYDQVMIYQYTGSDATRQGKYIDRYQKDKNNGVFDNLQDVQNDYNKHIKPLLKMIVDAQSVVDIYEAEKNEEYANFSCKQILRKITILMSVMPESKYKHEFMWVFNGKVLDELARFLEIDFDDDKTFLEKNHCIYETAKKYAGIQANAEKSDYLKLNYFLWDLGKPGFHFAELSDFNCCNLIFNGAPGTGKTYGVTEGIQKLQALYPDKYKDMKLIQFHPSFTYQDFIEGIKPSSISNGNVVLEVVNGSFKDFCIKVRKENESFFENYLRENNKSPEDKDYPHYFFVVDEINRGNLSKIFGETFTLLESDYRDRNFDKTKYSDDIKLMETPLSNVIKRSSSREDLIYKEINGSIVFGIPFNIHFIGLMNDVDRSIDAFDLALRRRFKWIATYCDYEVIGDELKDYDNVDEYVESCRRLNEMICGHNQDGLNLGKSYEIGHAFFLKIRNLGGDKTITSNKKNELFDTYISGTLREYIRQVKDENEVDVWVEKARTAFGISK